MNGRMALFSGSKFINGTVFGNGADFCFENKFNKVYSAGLTESVSVGGETLSMAGELISNMSGILSDEDIS